MKRFRKVLVGGWIILLFVCPVATVGNDVDAEEDEQVRILKQQLRFGKIEDRKLAARRLGSLKTDAAFNVLVEGLRDRDEGVRKAVITAVVSFQTPRAVDALNGVFKRCETGTKIYMIRQLSTCKKIGETKVFLLALDDRAQSVQMEAVKHLNKRRDQGDVLDAFLKFMGKTGEEDWTVKGEIAGYVALKPEDDREMQIMAKGLKDRHFRVVFRALSRLQSLEIDSETKLKMALPTRKSEYSSVRGKLVDVLQEIGNDECADALTKMLRLEKSPSNSQKICRALGAIGGERAAKGLSEYILYKDEKIRMAAVTALGEIQNDTSKKSLVRALRDESDGIVKAAIRGLARFESPDVIDNIVRAVPPDASYDVFAEVIAALEVIDHPKSISTLIRMTERGSMAVRTEAVKALGRKKALDAAKPITEQVKKNIGGEGRELRGFLRAAVNALGQIGGPEIEEGLIMLAECTFEDVRTDALHALGDLLTTATTRTLVRALSDESVAVRVAALCSIRKTLSPHAVNAVMKLLGDPDAGVRLAAIETLEEYALPKTASALVQEYDDDKLYRAAVRALSKIDSKKAKKFLLRALSHRDPKVRLDALTGLGLSWAGGDTDVAKGIMEFLEKEGGKNTRTAAIAALGNTGVEEAKTKLKELAGGSVVPDAKAAVQALGRTGDRQLADFLLELLDTARYTVRVEAMRALGDIGNEKAVETLVKLLGERDVTVRRAAVEGLGKFDTEESRKALIESLGDKSTIVIRASMQALVRYRDDAEVREAVIKLMESRSPRVRKEAAKLLPLYVSHDIVPALLAHMKDDGAKDVRAVCLRSLRRLMNRDLGENVDDWQKWWHTERDKPVVELVDAGFREKGYVIDDMSRKKTMGEYLRALTDDNDYIRYNAVNRLRQMTGQAFGYAPDAKDNSKAIRMWNRWWQMNGSSFK